MDMWLGWEKARNVCMTLGLKCLRKQSFGSLKKRWKDNIKIDLREIDCEDVDWLELMQSGINWWFWYK
jgi:hypothetical protein